MKNSAIICVWKASGANLVDSDWPTGDRHSSATVNTSRISTIHSRGVLLSVPLANGRKSRNAPPIATLAKANFFGVEGWRVPSFCDGAGDTRGGAVLQERR